MVPAPTASTQIGTVSFILDADEFIQNATPLAAERIGLATNSITGHQLSSLLLEYNPEWKGILPKSFREISSPITLPLYSKRMAEMRLCGAIEVQTIPINDGHIVVTLSPILASESELKEASFQEISPDPFTLAQLFLRLKTSESRIENYMSHYPGIFFSQRPDFSFSFISPNIQSLLGVDSRPLLKNGNAFFKLIAESDIPHFMSEMDCRAPKGQMFSQTYRLRHQKEERVIYIMDIRTPRLSPTGLLLGYEGVLIDITRQTIAENHLSRTAWKESLAIITGGLVHDFSNIMAGIFSLSELYFSSLEPEHPWYRGMQQIMDNSKQARKLVRRIIDLNRDISGTPNYHNLEKLIEDQLDLIRIVLPQSTQLETVFTQTEIPVYLDEVSFRQMLLNLAMNSRDAIGRKGLIKICVETIPAQSQIFDNGQIIGPWITERDGVLISFHDNGCGIPSKHIQKILDPFFTTKESTKGSGFGLYNAKLFVHQAHGAIDVFSEEGKGTTFQIFLPVADFTESMPSKENTPIVTQRHKLAVYANNDPSGFELVSRMREKEWELCTFQHIEVLKAYLKDASFQPEVAIIFRIGDDPQVSKVIHMIRKEYPLTRQVLIIHGSNPDIFSTRESEVDLILDESKTPDQILRKLEKEFLAFQKAAS
jgi:signal transduction histidine kinase